MMEDGPIGWTNVQGQRLGCRSTGGKYVLNLPVYHLLHRPKPDDLTTLTTMMVASLQDLL
jgi:hypothetical protein